jgi:GTP-binding protein Era
MKPAYKLHHKMLAAVEETFTDADVVIYVTEVKDRKIEEDLQVKLSVLSVPLYVVINKIDTAEQQVVEEAVNFWKETLKPKVILPISALHNFSVDNIVTEILKDIPEGPAYFDKDEALSDRNMRFFTAEIVRERILSLYQQEIPYSVEVVVTSYKEDETIDRILVVIYCARETQKAILIGHQGKAIKKLGMESRKKLEVMQNLDSLGVGFSVASHDMDIRGSGNLLGDEQSVAAYCSDIRRGRGAPAHRGDVHAR